MKTMIAKYPGTCRACGESIKRGDSINFFGRGTAEHVRCNPGYAGGDPFEDDEQGGCEDERAGLEPGTLASDRRLARRGLSVTRFSSGHVQTVNSRGRCEDAPCWVMKAQNQPATPTAAMEPPNRILQPCPWLV